VKFLSTYLFLLSLLVLSQSAAYAQKTVIVGDLPNFTRIDDTLYRGGRPNEVGMKILKERGIKTVINLRNNKEDGAQEEVWAREQGLNFYTVGLNIWFRPSASQINKIMQIIERAENQPVYVHCNLGADRTGMAVAIYRIKHDGWTAKDANAEAKDAGLGKWQIWMRDFINDYYKEIHKPKAAAKPQAKAKKQ
jgi:protein tyrosine/serine phosphatase